MQPVERYNEAWDALEKLPASDKGKAARTKIKAAQLETRPLTRQGHRTCPG
jgi:hypothetical protein